MNKTAIAWAEWTWNPVTGCTPASEGCLNCYAQRMARRFNQEDFSGNYFSVTLHPDRLDQPLRRRKPARIFVCSMSDLFHPDVPFEYIAAVFGFMAGAPIQHTFMILTKRPQRMADFFKWLEEKGHEACKQNHYPDEDLHFAILMGLRVAAMKQTTGAVAMGPGDWPLPNVWLGVTAENQARYEERAPYLLRTPAAKRFVSYEPALGPLNAEVCQPDYDGTGPTIGGNMLTGLDWIIAGGETGPGARECREVWVQEVYNQCYSAKVSFFFKQGGKKWNPSQPDKFKFQSLRDWESHRAWPK